MVVVSIAVEGPTDVPVARRVLEAVGLGIGPVYQKGGKGGLDRRLSGYNRAALISPWMVLRDLDHDAPCPAALVAELLPRRSPSMALRIAVPQVEAWLLADAERMSSYLSVPRSAVPPLPEELPDAKQRLVDLARATWHESRSTAHTTGVRTLRLAPARVFTAAWSR
jgi:hypothetical protein